MSKNSHVIECPDCGFEQTEPRMAVSSNCRSCGVHFEIKDGKAETNKTSLTRNFTPSANAETTPLLKPEDTDTKNSTPETIPTTNTEDSASTKKSILATSSTLTPKPKQSSPSFIQKAAASAGLINNKQKKRDVQCFECDKVHSALSAASSTQCPACGSYISLKNYDITSNWNQRIQTRGDVVIHKKVTVTGITIHCHHLTTHGDFTGGVDCSGNFTISNHSKIMGKVCCKKLIIEKKAKVEFATTVQCQDAIIDGNVTGHFECSGKLALKKKAILTGNIKVATMAVEEGARHNGRMSIGQ